MSRKKMFLIVGLLIFVNLPIFRWYPEKFSIVGKLIDDVKIGRLETFKMIGGNIYYFIVESDIYYNLFF